MNSCGQGGDIPSLARLRSSSPGNLVSNMASSTAPNAVVEEFSQQQMALLLQLKKTVSTHPFMDADALRALLQGARLETAANFDAKAAPYKSLTRPDDKTSLGALEAIKAAWENIFTSMETKASGLYTPQSSSTGLSPSWATTLAKWVLEAAIAAVLSYVIDKISELKSGDVYDLLCKLRDALNEILNTIDDIFTNAFRALLDLVIALLQDLIPLVDEPLKTLLEALLSAAEDLRDLL
ncbi:hypothetical protein GOP47_0011280 [Adiantum capillus-veneris]|uniref:Uncharacterized protein n=1 Tax=Adiantum capillus-veneris TaxID=13818 RepID=A0A9D4ZGK6_ADICA|nr:hypothetical protein GOP47_0011280 [Adiantum capillus-veneris]